jgi:hypothetical protein
MTSHWWLREREYRAGLALLISAEIRPELQPSLRNEWNFEGPSYLADRMWRDREERLAMKVPKGSRILVTEDWVYRALEFTGHARGEAAVEAIDVALQPDAPEKPKKKYPKFVQRVGVKGN